MKKLKLMFLCSLIMGKIAVASEVKRLWVNRTMGRQSERSFTNNLTTFADGLLADISDGEEEDKPVARVMVQELKTLSGFEALKTQARIVAGQGAIRTNVGQEAACKNFISELEAFKAKRGA